MTPPEPPTLSEIKTEKETSREQKLMFLCLRGRANSAPQLIETIPIRLPGGGFLYNTGTVALL